MAIALGQLLCGIAGVVSVMPAGGSVMLMAMLYLSPAVATVFGMFRLVFQIGDRPKVLNALDIVSGSVCAVGLIAMWDLPRFITGPNVNDVNQHSWLEVLGTTSVGADLIGLGISYVVWTAQPRGRRLANRFAVLALLVAAMADSQIFTKFAEISLDQSRLGWLAGHLLLIFGSLFVADSGGELQNTVTSSGIIKIATVLNVGMLLSGLLIPEEIPPWRGLIAVVVALAAFRNIAILWTQGQMRRRLEVAATTDMLTGIPNRASFEQAVQRQTRRIRHRHCAFLRSRPVQMGE